MRRREFYWSLFDEHEKKQVEGLRTDQIEAIYTVLPQKILGRFWIWRDGFENWKPFVEFPELLVSLRKHDDREFESPPPPPSRQTSDQDEEGSRLHTGVEGTVIETTLTESSSHITLSGSHPGFRKVTPKKEAKPASKQVSKQVGKSSGTARSKLATEEAITGTRMMVAPKLDDASSAKGTTGRTSFDFANHSANLSLENVAAGDDRSNHRFLKILEIRIVANDRAYENKTIDISLKGMQLENPLPAGLPRYFNVEIRQRNQVIPIVCSEMRTGDGKPRLKIEVNDYSTGLLALLLAG